MNAERTLLSFMLQEIPHSLWLGGAVSPISELVGFPIRLIPKKEDPAEQPIMLRSRIGRPASDGSGMEVKIIEVRI